MTEHSKLKKERNQVDKKKRLKKKKVVQKKKLIETSCKSSINTVVKEHVSVENFTF